MIIGLGESNNAPTEKVRILGDGKVGIGTTSPNQNLMVMDAIANEPQIRIETSDGGSKRLDLLVDSSSNAIISAQQSSQDINVKARNNTIFKQGSTAGEVEAMRIDSSGNVGIGTSSPAQKLHIQSSGDTVVRVTSADGNAAFLDLGDASDPDGGRIHYDSGSNLVFNTSSSERMRINSSGDLCVGTTSAIGKSQIATSASEIGLTVSNDTHDSSLQILATAANKNSNIFFGDNDDGNVGRIDYDHNNNSLAFFVSGAERARFDSSGDFSIGSSTINLQSSNRTVLNVNGQTSTALCFNSNDTITGFMFADSGEFRIQAEAGASNLVKIRNNNGTICHFDDDGIKFNGDTAAANGLDDYEEGTFTPNRIGCYINWYYSWTLYKNWRSLLCFSYFSNSIYF